jgi:hypothetical protein
MPRLDATGYERKLCRSGSCMSQGANYRRIRGIRQFTMIRDKK